LRATQVAFQQNAETYYDLPPTRLLITQDVARQKQYSRWRASERRNVVAIHDDRHRPDLFRSSSASNEGFGEGNFRALFESIELDQIRRGVLKA
jgi:4-hydroxyphenylpyruvate dioxygenase